MISAIPCIVCGKTLTIEESDRPVTREPDGRLCHQMTMGGVDCVAHGNYGSAAWDPIYPRNPPLGFVICDECFRERRDRMRAVEGGMCGNEV